MTRQHQYQKIRDLMLERIAQGDLKPGARLPSERELAEGLQCSFLTVRRALQELVDRGIIVRHVGKGTFVADGCSVGASGGCIGVLFNPEGGAYASGILRALHQQARQQRSELMVAVFTQLDQNAQASLVRLQEQGCRSVIIPWFSADRRSAAAVRDCIRKSPLPVSIAEHLPGCEANCCEDPAVFGTGDLIAVQRACRYLQALGHERIAFLSPDQIERPAVQRRMASYAQFVNENALPNLTATVGRRAAELDQLVACWRKQNVLPLAVVALDDLEALRLLTALHKAGLSVPDDVALLGYNDTPAAALADPPLSSMRDSYEYVAEALLAHARGQARGELVQSPGSSRQHLVVRESCGGCHLPRQKLVDALRGLALEEGYEISSCIQTVGSSA